MPKLKTYDTPELNYQGRGVDSSSELRYSSEMGRAMSNFGRTFEEIGDTVYRRAEQQETSDLNAEFSDLSYQVTEEIDEQVRTGTIDAGEFSEKLQERINKLDQDISTSAGRDSFERNAARVRSMAFKRAARGQAAVAGARATNNLKAEIGNYSASLFSDPSEFATNYQAMIDSIDDQVATGTIKEQDGLVLKSATGKDFAKSAVRGWANLDPSLAEQKLNSGEFDGYLDGDTKAQMQGYINQQRTAKEVEKNRADAAIKKAEKLKADAWYESNLPKIIEGDLSTDQIMKSPLRPQQKMSLLKAVNANAHGGGMSNPAVVNDIRRRILLPEGDPDKIVDIQQFIGQVGTDISMNDLGKLNSFLQKTPEGQAMVDKERRLMDFAKKSIAQKNFMTGGFGTDVNSEKNISQFMDDYQKAKQELIKEGKNPSLLVDPNAKEYFGNRVNTYRLSPQQVIDNQADMVRKQATMQAQGKKMVTVIAPGGQEGQIPEENLQKALERGYRRK